MTTQETKPQKHLDLIRRKLIERGLDEGRTFTYIANLIEKELNAIRTEFYEKTKDMSPDNRNFNS